MSRINTKLKKAFHPYENSGLVRRTLGHWRHTGAERMEFLPITEHLSLTSQEVENMEEGAAGIDATEDAGLNEACGVFGCVTTGTWPTQVDVANVICLGLVGLQHR